MLISDALKIIEKFFLDKEYENVVQGCKEILVVDKNNKKAAEFLHRAEKKLKISGKNSHLYPKMVRKHTSLVILFAVLIALCIAAIVYLQFFNDISPENPLSMTEETTKLNIANQVLAEKAYADIQESFGTGPIPRFIAKNTQADTPAYVIFDASSSEGQNDAELVRYTWDFGDGQVGRGKYVSHEYFKNGTYTVMLRVRDSNGQNQVTTLSILVGQVVGEAPLSKIYSMPRHSSGKIRAQAPLKIFLSGVQSTDLDGDIKNYEWNFGDGSFGNSMEIYHLYNQPGEYPITLMVTDDEGNTDLDYIKLYLE